MGKHSNDRDDSFIHTMEFCGTCERPLKAHSNSTVVLIGTNRVTGKVFTFSEDMKITQALAKGWDFRKDEAYYFVEEYIDPFGNEETVVNWCFREVASDNPTPEATEFLGDYELLFTGEGNCVYLPTPSKSTVEMTQTEYLSSEQVKADADEDLHYFTSVTMQHLIAPTNWSDKNPNEGTAAANTVEALNSMLNAMPYYSREARQTNHTIDPYFDGYQVEQIIDLDITERYHSSLFNIFTDRTGNKRLGSMQFAEDGNGKYVRCVKCSIKHYYDAADSPVNVLVWSSQYREELMQNFTYWVIAHGTNHSSEHNHFVTERTPTGWRFVLDNEGKRIPSGYALSEQLAPAL